MTGPLPPGTILQLMFLRERLKKRPPGRFIEVGPGSGEITALLLSLGWTGVSYDLESRTVERLCFRFAQERAAGRFDARCENVVRVQEQPADLVISCMVMEHMTDEEQFQYLAFAASVLQARRGLLIGLVPGSPAHWGIEDDIAGHLRRYTQADLNQLALSLGWRVRCVSGLTFPVSNVLLPVSNWLVHRREKNKLALSAHERTKASGIRHVPFKTHFPSVLNLVLNPWVLWPLHVLQKLCARTPAAMVIYFEWVRHEGALQ